MLAGGRISLTAKAPTTEETAEALAQLAAMGTGRRLQGTTSEAVATKGCSGFVQSGIVEATREELEAQAAEMFRTRGTESSTLAAPPTLEQMLVGGSEANALLAAMFTREQQSHHVMPVVIEPLAGLVAIRTEDFDDNSCVASAPRCQPKDKLTPRCTNKYSTQCCCGALQSSSQEIQSNPTCWFSVYTASRCCDTAKGPTGDISCWDGEYDYTFCCTAAPEDDTGGRRLLHAAGDKAKHTSVGRGLQSNGPESEGELVAGVRVILKATAPTSEEADAILATMFTNLGHRRLANKYLN